MPFDNQMPAANQMPPEIEIPAWAQPSVFTRLLGPTFAGDEGSHQEMWPQPIPVSHPPAAADHPGSRSYRSVHSSETPVRMFTSPSSHRVEPVAEDGPPPPTRVGRWTNQNTDTITDEEFWAYLRKELLR